MEIYDMELLYDAFLKSKKGVQWKADTQKFEMNWLDELVKLHHELKDRTYTTKKMKSFILNERGRTRLITGNCMRDKIVRHVLNDNYLVPVTRPYLIYDNGSSLKGKGSSFAINRLITHLERFYKKYGNNGYIMTMDLSKYYDNILHSKAKEILLKHIDNNNVKWLTELIFNDYKVDVSYMSDEEYKNCYNTKFNSLEYQKIPNSKKTREKYMEKCVSIGDQTSQIIGISYLSSIDNYIKIVKGIKYYGRYNDDSYIIAKEKKDLIKLLNEIEPKFKELGLFLNKNKTKILKLSDGFRFLQIRFQLTDSGRIIKKINPKRVTAMRRRLKKLKSKVDNDIVPYCDVLNMYKSWIGSYRKFLSKKQRSSLDSLFCELYCEYIGEVVK